MAKRKDRIKRYQENVFARIGGIDQVVVDTSAEFFYNARGGKIYNDISKQKKLDIPRTFEGSNYEVLSVGFHMDTPIFTIKKGEEVEVFVVPDDYKEWINELTIAARSGIKPLPAIVNLGYNNDRYYAEFVI